MTTTRLGRAERRESILDGATRAFASGGYAATSMQDIAEAASITPLIVYRHFDSKNALYRATLDRVCRSLGDEFGAAPDGGVLGVGAGSVLVAARRDPDGFRLLWRHAAREPEFARYADDLRNRATRAVRAALGDRVPRQALPWAAHATIGYLVESVLTWLEFGDPGHDEAFVKATNAALRAGVRSWSAT